MTASETETAPGTYAWLDDRTERDWLMIVKPSRVLANAHRMYDFMRETGTPADSYTRELAFEKTAQALGIDGDVLYDAWVDGKPAPINFWGTIKADVGEGFCADCERESPHHYESCPTKP